MNRFKAVPNSHSLLQLPYFKLEFSMNRFIRYTQNCGVEILIDLNLACKLGKGKTLN